MSESIGWWLTKYHNEAEKNLFWMSIFAFFTHSDVLIWERPNQNSLLDYRYRVINQIIAGGLDVNLHPSELEVWWPNDRASLPNILGEMIAIGLMTFHTTTQLSPPLVMLIVVWAYGWSWNWKLDKVPLLVRLLHMLGAHWQDCKSQLQFKKRVLRLGRMTHHSETIYSLSSFICIRLSGPIRILCGLKRRKKCAFSYSCKESPSDFKNSPAYEYL